MTNIKPKYKKGDVAYAISANKPVKIDIFDSSIVEIDGIKHVLLFTNEGFFIEKDIYATKEDIIKDLP